MGIYLPNIEMPKDRGVYIAIEIDGQVYAKPLGALEWKRYDQKSVPVPPHGRLIDADAIRADIDKKRPGRSYEDAWALTIIDAAPTIIPAEDTAPKPITNYDLLIRKSPEELAKWLERNTHYQNGDMPWLEWLKQEASDGAP